MDIKILGSGCSKCKTLHNHVLTAVQELGLEGETEIEKIEDFEEMMKYNVLTTPVLLVNGQTLIKGRVAPVSEIKKLLMK